MIITKNIDNIFDDDNNKNREREREGQREG
jgi:hypothetical protein